MRYWVIHLTETDGDIVLWPCRSGKDIDDYISLMELHREEYAIIKGELLKNFENISFNHKKLKGIK